MATDLHKGVLSQILLKNDKMTKSSTASQSFKITAKALTLLERICCFMYFPKSNIYLGGLARF